MRLEGGKIYYDIPVGIICLESWFPKPPGHIRNPRSFDFPIVMKVIKNVDVPRLLFKRDPAIEDIIINAGRELEQEGVKAIAGSCGFMARYQQALANAVHVPVVLSSLVQLPLVRAMHGPDASIGVLTASAASLEESHFNSLEEMRSVSVRGMESRPEFRETILECARNDFDMDRLEKEIVEEAADFASAARLDALILECTDLSAFAKPVQDILKIPVYDINGLVKYVCDAVERKRF